ncbi:MAG: hypothetical protein R3288_04285 [Woeseiaceae bacterium]|nr:hypothetical protein [Woeseiaceae bacterium]
MRRWLAVAGAALLLGACSGDSSFPNPTGKGSVGFINAVKGSPDISFLIEQRLIATVPFQSGSAGSRWDDFDYVFNFRTLVAGESSARRIASMPLKIDANQAYTFVLTGAVAAPTVTVLERPERSFDTGGTVFESSFGHLAESLADVDVYFGAPGTAPMLGEEVGTLSFGEFLDPVDVEAGDYVLTVTTSGDPADVLYESDTRTYAAGVALFIAVFDGDEADTAPVIATQIGTGGGVVQMPDGRVPPTVRFLHGAIDKGNVDNDNDEMLMNQVLADFAFGEASADIDTAVGATDYTYTPAGSTGSTVFEGAQVALEGAHYNFVVFGPDGARLSSGYRPERRSISTEARISLFHGASNHTLLDLYLVDADEPIDDVLPLQILSYAFLSAPVVRPGGSYDLYVTVRAEKTVVAGPLRIDAALGDVVEIMIYDTVDPNTAELNVVPAP